MRKFAMQYIVLIGLLVFMGCFMWNVFDYGRHIDPDEAVIFFNAGHL